ncbi:ATP-binding cassette domain-containing protein, partial [Actinotignum timonense]|uniref:ATP-binding cassette domain-containing protein n=1 Tax=Actinotignum timonense TaxID=1870995 RepID=UPI00254E62AB
PRMRVGETVAEPLRALHLASGQAARERVREALALVDVDPDRADEYPRTFSGGQRQRLAIARALSRQVPVYIFDDSFSALDYQTDYELRQALQEALDQA